MKERLLELIDKTNEIEKLFYKITVTPGVLIPSTEVIYNNKQFIFWIQELKFELQEIYDKKNNIFIENVIKDVSANFNGYRDREMFDKIKGDLLTIKRNIDTYYPQTNSTTLKNQDNSNLSKKNKIFISHSSKDIQYVEEIISLFEFLGLNNEEMFCSSIEGYGIPLGETIFDYLRNQFNEYNLFVIFIHSHNYYDSPICLNEMGAAWVLRNNFCSILLPNFDFSNMTGVVSKEKIAIKLDSEDYDIKEKLNQLREQLIKEFNMKRNADSRWEKKRDAFILNIKNLQNQ